MPDAAANTYDALPYQSRFVPQAHPDRLATMSVLHGLNPPKVETCRVLELGCADGGNLLRAAESLPRASFVGVDLSARQVDEGRAAAAGVGIDNVELRAMSLTEVDDSFGRFDYIVCHGVYSWVSAAVRDRILTVCARNLARDGVAYVSYNTYPGWHQRGMVREMMAYHTHGLPDPTLRVRESRALVDLLAASAVPQDGPHAHALKEEAKHLGKSRDTYVFHDYLEDENHPVYFHEFVSHARVAGLDYLGPARFSIHEVNLPAEVTAWLNRVGTDRVRREQYFDFLSNRTFRHSLLCHAGSAALEGPSAGAVRGLRITALAWPESAAPDVRTEGSPEPFATKAGHKLSVGQPLLKAALVALAERRPHATGFDELFAEAQDRIGRSGGDASAFATFLLHGHLANLVDLHTYDPPVSTSPGDRPRARALARIDAAAGQNAVTLRNDYATLGDFDRVVLPFLDGTCDREEVVGLLCAAAAEGRLQIHREGQPVTDPGDVRAAVASTLDGCLSRLAAEAMFEAREG